MPRGKIVDESGNIYGKLVVLKRGPSQPQKAGTSRAQWWCECSCKRACVLILGKLLRVGQTRSCGCLRKESARGRTRLNSRFCDDKNRGRKMHGTMPDEVGSVYGMLNVIKRGPDKIFPSGGRHATWWCKCECGNPKLILKSGNWLRQTKSSMCCGCQHKKIREKAYNKTNPISKRVDKHKKNLAVFGKAELVGEYLGDRTKTKYKCLIHDQIHFAIPTNMGRGRGLPCCKRDLGWDSLEAIIDGSFRAPNQKCLLYMFRLKRFPSLIKLGIASHIDRRPDEEYGDLIRSWTFKNRVDAALVEISLKQQTIDYSFIPDELIKWIGRTEIRRIDPNILITRVQLLVDEFLKEGRWQFALKYISMNNKHRLMVANLIQKT
jgi:hypothetical protein